MCIGSLSIFLNIQRIAISRGGGYCRWWWGKEWCPMNLRKQKARTPNGAKVAYKLMHFVMFHFKADHLYAPIHDRIDLFEG